MNPVQKALWYVEIHSRDPLNLEQIADACHTSPYHLTRAFSAVFGRPLMRYLRQRRLSEAASQLAEGAADILTLAMEAGYASHEAFSRAFKEEFDCTPEAIRAQGHTRNLSLTEAFVMTSSPAPTLAPPRIEMLNPMLLAGIVERYDCNSPAGIPNQWQRFLPYFNSISATVSRDAYGVVYNFDSEGFFDYLTGVEISAQSSIPFGLVQLQMPAQKYAVFSHAGHVAEIRTVIAAIWSEGLAAAGLEPNQGPTLEKYGPNFNPATGLGGFEIWIAVA